MRGQDERTGSMFSYVDLEERVPIDHPLRKILVFVNAALAALNAEFAKLYSADGRPSIAPERLLRAALIQILFSIRSERQLMEQMQIQSVVPLVRGLGIDDPVWVPTVFTQKPRPAFGTRHRPPIPGGHPGAQGRRRRCYRTSISPSTAR